MTTTSGKGTYYERKRMRDSAICDAFCKQSAQVFVLQPVRRDLARQIELFFR
jgi:hypothetical protein